jgi:hypothetical protein
MRKFDDGSKHYGTRDRKRSPRAKQRDAARKAERRAKHATQGRTR